MGRTIALKLSEKEDQIITQLNKQGMSNSELLRNALRHYFEYLHTSTSQDSQEKSILQTKECTNMDAYDFCKTLKQEMQELWEQAKKSQEQIESDIAGLHRQLYQLSINDLISNYNSSPVRAKVVSDIHNEVDEFLKKRSQRQKL